MKESNPDKKMYVSDPVSTHFAPEDRVDLNDVDNSFTINRTLDQRVSQSKRHRNTTNEMNIEATGINEDTCDRESFFNHKNR